MFKPIVHYGEFSSKIEKVVVDVNETKQLELVVTSTGAVVDEETGAEASPVSSTVQFKLIDSDVAALEPEVKVLELEAADVKPVINLMAQLSKSVQ